VTSGVPYAEVIGDPVAHSKSPLIHRFWLEKLNMAGDYRPVRVTADELASYFAARAGDSLWRGCNITMPHKRAALAYVHKHQDPSFPPEPVNAVTARAGRLDGFNFDIHGLMEPLRALDGGRLDLKVPTQRDNPRVAVVLGSGAMLYSAAWVLMSLGYHSIVVAARNRVALDAFLAEADKRQFGALPWGDPLPTCDLLINATPLGMEGRSPLPYDAGCVREGGVVLEMGYHPLETPLLADARRRGLRVVDGLQILVGQAAPSFQLFFGAAAPRSFDWELRELLTT
jgi:shikimate dehydrogenase